MEKTMLKYVGKSSPELLGGSEKHCQKKKVFFGLWQN